MYKHWAGAIMNAQAILPNTMLREAGIVSIVPDRYGRNKTALFGK